jgi:PmbA protein
VILDHHIEEERHDDFAEQVLKLASRRAEQAEVYAVSSLERPVFFEANQLKQMRAVQSQSVTLRVISKGQIGLAGTSRLDRPQTLVDQALTLAPFGRKALFDLPPDSPPDNVPGYDPSIPELSQKDLAEMGRETINRVSASNPAIVCALEVNPYVARVVILNSQGCRTAFKKTFLWMNLQASLIEKGEVVELFENETWGRHPLDSLGLAERVIEKFKLADRSVNVSSQPMPVIFTPKGFASTLLPPLQEAFNGEWVWQELSPLAGLIGEHLFDARLSLYDDGRIPFSPRAYPCDGEGVATQRTPLLEQGVVKNFYYDLHTAALAQTKSTGNGCRLPKEKPSPMPTTTILAPGETSYDQMLANIGEGLIVDQTLGAWAGYVENGDFSAQVQLGYKVERGEVVGRVKNTTISGNLFEALANLAAVGNDAVWISGAYYLPHLSFQSLSVTGTD